MRKGYRQIQNGREFRSGVQRSISLSSRVQNQDYVNYPDLVIEVNIPEGVLIDSNTLSAEQSYDSANRILSMPINLKGKGDIRGQDAAVFNFMYRLADGYEKNKVVFTAFAREALAVPGTALEGETSELNWSRSEKARWFGVPLMIRHGSGLNCPELPQPLQIRKRFGMDNMIRILVCLPANQKSPGIMRPGK